MNNKFDFLIDYKYYGRPRLNEDELDDMLNLTPDAQPQADQQQPPADTPPPAMDAAPEGEPMPIDTPPPAEGEPMPADVPAEQPAMETPSTEGNAVELDVTQLVLKQDEINKNVQATLDQISQLMKSNEDLKLSVDTQLKDIEQKNQNTVNDLKQELEKRNPTPMEQLSLRSMSSFPYNIKLSDYWKPTTEDKYKYQIANPNEPNQSVETQAPVDQEYILKQSDVMTGYDETFVKKSF